MAAASALIIAISGWLLLANRSAGKKDIAKEEAIEAKKGSKTRSILPDGTTVMLNAGSKLSYDEDFRGSIRNVTLEGEAFFDVIKDAKRPFIVHTSGIDIKVLGTAFYVKSYPEDKTVETTLYRGSVKVFREEESEDKAIQLRPNEKLILAKKAAIGNEELSNDVKPSATKKPLSGNFTIAHIDSTKKENERLETAWLYSRLEFEKNNFEELAQKLERWYNVSIVFTDEKVKQLSFTGKFENETVEQVFKYLREANTLFNYKINNHEISVGSAQ
jgi:ferric-dicitrate binding protein FerR (iron transport regulator)